MTCEAIVAGSEVESWREVPGVQPAISAEEADLAARAAREDPRFVAALRRRGIEDPQRVQIDPLSVGSFPHLPQGRRILWATPYLRPRPSDNGYARPIENLRACVDISTGEVLDVLDGEPVPLSTADGDYAVAEHRTGLRPLDIVQPDGPSFELDGHELRWQGWHVHAALHPIDGLVLSDVTYDGRSILHRAALSEMVVPYGDPDEGFYWRSYFDAGEYGLGRTTTPLTLGCDCLGEIRYMDAVLADSDGEPRTIANAICIHEEDAGILWKHYDTVTETSEVRRARRLVISNVATLGNYDYGFYWSLHLDGSIELEVRMTGIVLTRGVRPGEPLRHATRLAPDLAAPHHQHLFNVRLDMAVDGPSNRVYEVDMVPSPAGEWGGAMETAETLIERESQGRRMIDPLDGAPLARGQRGRAQRRRRARGLQARPVRRPAAAGRAGLERRAPRRLRPRASVGDALRARRAARGRRVPQPEPRRRGPGGVDRAGPRPRRHERRALAHVRRLARRSARGLARDAGRAGGLRAAAGRLLRSQPGARRAAVRPLRVLEHRVVVGGGLRHRLDDVPVFDDLAAAVEPEDVGDRAARGPTGSA